MQRSAWRRRAFILGGVIVALSVGIVFASIPFLPPHHVSITSTVSHSVHAGSQSYPGFYVLQIPGVLNNQNLGVAVNVSNGNATFCVITDSNFQPWYASGNRTNGPANTFPYTQCLLQQQTAQSTLLFTSTSPGTWDVIALNYILTRITVTFSPA